jgi:hypothetical protein
LYLLYLIQNLLFPLDHIFFYTLEPLKDSLGTCECWHLHLSFDLKIAYDKCICGLKLRVNAFDYLFTPSEQFFTVNIDLKCLGKHKFQLRILLIHFINLYQVLNDVIVRDFSFFIVVVSCFDYTTPSKLLSLVLDQALQIPDLVIKTLVVLR